MKDELNCSHHGGGVVYLLHSVDINFNITLKLKMAPYLVTYQVERKLHRTALVKISGKIGSFRKLSVNMCLKTAF